MKRKNNKFYLKIGVLLFGISLLLSNCAKEKPIFGEPQAFGLFDLTQQKVKILRKENIPKSIFNFIDDRTSGTRQITSNKYTEGYLFDQGTTRNTALGTVDDSKSVVVTLDTQTRYTFLVETSEPNTNEVINLVIIDDGIQPLEYFVKYQFDPNRQVTSAFNTIDMTEFEGRISFYNFEGSLIGDNTMGSGRTSNSSGPGIPCDLGDDNTNDDPNDDPNDDNNNNNQSGGSGGGAGQYGSGGDDTNNNQGGGDTGGTTGDPNAGGGGGGDNCDVEITYEQCGCGGDANGHGPSGDSCCEGSPMIITISCDDIIARTSSSPQHDEEIFSCYNIIGAIIERNDCEEVQDQVIDLEFSSKIDELEGQLGELREYGYAQFGDLSYQALDVSPNNTVKIITSNNLRGAIHTHPDSLLTINPLTGKQFIGYPVEMYSPEDFKSFIQMVQNADGTNFDASDVYSALVTPEGNYMLKFAGNTSDIPSISTIGTLANDMFYRLYVTRAQDKMTGYLRYLKASLDITNVVIYEFDSVGTVTGKYIDENGEIQTIQC